MGEYRGQRQSVAAHECVLGPCAYVRACMHACAMFGGFVDPRAFVRVPSLSVLVRRSMDAGPHCGSGLHWNREIRSPRPSSVR
jgi:hypothetical protein